jgi:hypothetical protein
MSERLVRLKDSLDEYHQQRADKHGWLYIATNYDASRRIIMYQRHQARRVKGLYEARSLATGVICTLLPEFVEEIVDAEK